MATKAETPLFVRIFTLNDVLFEERPLAVLMLHSLRGDEAFDMALEAALRAPAESGVARDCSAPCR